MSAILIRLRRRLRTLVRGGRRIENRVSGYAGFRRLVLKTDEPGEAKDESTLAETGHIGTAGFSPWGSITKGLKSHHKTIMINDVHIYGPRVGGGT